MTSPRQRPHYTMFRGDRWSLWALQERLAIKWSTLSAWLAHGGISERRIERFLAERENRRRMRDLSRSSGIPMHALRRRLELGWSIEEAAATPLHAARRKPPADEQIERS